ncbi:MAG: single-stranded-DNA-specific exonuclease RecJ [Holosporales bacterium]|jgi:single-stranded-DNA-specific exonuclease|nr:single-stranded-DNA-specific exonuclease RecJ [Holosporales bacterium]
MINSFSSKVWNFLPNDLECIQEFAQKFKISDLAVRVLLHRGFNSITEIESFLMTSLKTTIPDPALLIGMDLAVERVTKAIIARENIMIFGDYDVDGITSTCLMVKYLKLLGIDATFHIPNRFSDGYGINAESIRLAKERQIELFIAVDSGTNSVAEIEDAQNFGIDVIVLDHHVQSVEVLPNAISIVNPNRIDQLEIGSAHIKYLCAAGVVFIFIMALRRHLKNIGFLKDTMDQNILHFIDIVALGTLCDVVELKGVNRAFVKYFLKHGGRSIGLLALMKAFGLKTVESPEDLSFFLGPAINAAGRIGDPMIALQLFLEDDKDKADEIANKLLSFNDQRKILEKQLMSEAMAMIAKMNLESNKGICVYGKEWHEGVIGIIAGRIKEKFGKPTFVISFDSSGKGKGSARSVPGFHLGCFFEKAKKSRVIIDGGGHALAGGFSIHFDQVLSFQEFINAIIEYDFANQLQIDHELNYAIPLSSIAEELKILEPFGKGIEKPLFCIKKVRIKRMSKTKTGAHLMIIFSHHLGGKDIKGIIFSISSKSNLLRMLEQNKDELLDVVGSISYNSQFGGSIVIEDVASSLRN